MNPSLESLRATAERVAQAVKILDQRGVDLAALAAGIGLGLAALVRSAPVPYVALGAATIGVPGAGVRATPIIVFICGSGGSTGVSDGRRGAVGGGPRARGGPGGPARAPIPELH